VAATEATPAAADGARRSRLALAAFVLLLVVVAFARAHFASSTGIRITGDGADYQAMARSVSLEGRAPFVYRPAAPLLAGVLFGGSLAGFVLLCALAMFAALYTAGALAPDGLAGYGIAAVLFFNYQVLFAAANPARIDVLVLAVQLGFVALALRGRGTLFLALLPLCALLKESLLLSLGALALIAFAHRRELWAKAGASAAGFLVLHLVVRTLATPSASLPPYDGGTPVAAAAWSMLTSNLSLLTPLDFFIAWGGLCCIAGWLAFGGGASLATTRALLLPASSAFLLLFPLPLVTSCEPCAMCLGATLWSGVRSVVCGAAREDALHQRFDEGPVFPESWRYLESHGISITRGVRREEARKVLELYGERSGEIYNA